jgi:acetate---CoA ligase (ADP-forming)
MPGTGGRGRAGRCITEDERHNGHLDEAEAKALLARQGIDSPGRWVVPPPGRDTGWIRTLALLDEAPYPVVVKALVPGLAHKTEAGAVILHIRTREELAETIEAMGARFPCRSILVEEQVAPGLEVIVSGVRDGVFGPLVMVGLGGLLTEVLGDTAFAPAPVTEEDAGRLLDRLRCAPAFDGCRGCAVDRRGLCRAIGGISRLIAAGDIARVEVNPLVVHADRVLALDAKVVLSAQGEK